MEECLSNNFDFFDDDDAENPFGGNLEELDAAEDDSVFYTYSSSSEEEFSSSEEEPKDLAKEEAAESLVSLNPEPDGFRVRETKTWDTYMTGGWVVIVGWTDRSSANCFVERLVDLDWNGLSPNERAGWTSALAKREGATWTQVTTRTEGSRKTGLDRAEVTFAEAAATGALELWDITSHT